MLVSRIRNGITIILGEVNWPRLDALVADRPPEAHLALPDRAH